MTESKDTKKTFEEQLLEDYKKESKQYSKYVLYFTLLFAATTYFGVRSLQNEIQTIDKLKKSINNQRIAQIDSIDYRIYQLKENRPAVEKDIMDMNKLLEAYRFVYPDSKETSLNELLAKENKTLLYKIDSVVVKSNAQLDSLKKYDDESMRNTIKNGPLSDPPTLFLCLSALASGVVVAGSGIKIHNNKKHIKYYTQKQATKTFS